ncbi:nuclease-related domain-containing protein [Synechococcus sp. PCC 7336]|uniref:nuclease-related domain-containing protein n=1 Tax=Synechococcus sp. PCC 7336 TaxID=195250 RepID=UPI00034C0B0E|nr:nuclease-related domain-containing protein [Synechococcus sp. PCC 7336]
MSFRPHAGRNPHSLALARRIRAIQVFGAAGLTFIASFVLHYYFQNLNEAFRIVGETPVRVPVYVYAIFALLAISQLAYGVLLWRQGDRVIQGAKGEEGIAAELSQLKTEGWAIEYGLKILSVGDVDVVCRSPRGNAYAIEVKSHRGHVIKDGERLRRQYGQEIYDFENDFLAQTLRQAKAVQQLKQWPFVTPILAFSRASVRIGPGKLRGVYVLQKNRLADLLRDLG